MAVAVFSGGVSADEVIVVVVDAQEVDGSPDDVQIAGLDDIPNAELLKIIEGVLRVGATEDWIQEDSVLQRIEPPGGIEVHRIGGIPRDGVAEIERDPQLLGAATPQLVDHQTVGEVLVMDRRDGCFRFLAARGVDACRIAKE
ncbi:hypothetical protein D3C73_1048530 [compost metagenome]